ncbi:RICIN domain-containing protein [Streptomyces sp. NPDC056255]|uniref:RICIN domain-containing protein n=1 Tax=Streptomyces sp. NPDC056255 TaxID=3345764 RepID=UPI0035DE7132
MIRSTKPAGRGTALFMSAAAATLAVLSSAVPAQADQTPGPPGGATTIRNGNSGQCLEIADSSKSNGARAQQWTCVGQAGSYWYFEPVVKGGASYYRIRNTNSNKCLEVADSRTDNGAPVQQWTCYDLPGQLWYKTGTPLPGVAGLVNANSGKCLEVADSRTDKGAPVQQWSCSDIWTKTWSWSGM